MPTKLNKQAYDKLIEEDLDWLLKQSGGPVAFVANLVRASSDMIYKLGVDDKDFDGRVAEALSWLGGLPRTLEQDHVIQIVRWHLLSRQATPVQARTSDLAKPMTSFVKPVTYFVSGHLDLTQDEFKEHYLPVLDSAIAEGALFVVGDARGTDTMTQTYLAYRVDPARVRVFHMLTEPRNIADAFERVGGFESDAERDRAMTRASDEDIAWVRPGREKSGTARNLARRRAWIHIGGGMEARYDGRRQVHVRNRGEPPTTLVMDTDALGNALALAMGPTKCDSGEAVIHEGGHVRIYAGKTYRSDGLEDEPARIDLCPNGDILVNGRLAANDQEIVDGLRDFVHSVGRPDASGE